MPIRKSKAQRALDPNQGCGLPLYEAYYDAACLLLEKIESTVSMPLEDKSLSGILRVSAQSALLPALYLVRHTIELTLKEVLSLKDLAHGLTRPLKRNNHKLHDLWEELRKAVSEDFAEEFKGDGVALSTLLESIEVPIEELHLADEPSTNYRYPEALQEKKLFPVCISDVQSQMDAVIEMLRELERAYMALIDHNRQ